MALEEVKYIFGVHSVAPYDPLTGLPIGGMARVIGNLNVNLQGETIDLNGGSLPYPWASEEGLISTEGTLLLREYPKFLYESFLGASVVDNADEATGNVTTPANATGTSLIDATTGIATIALKTGEEADLKTASYAVKAVSATTVNVYAFSNVDFGTGAAVDFEDETLKINASPITVPSGAAVSIPNTGLEITGGSGTIAFVDDDSATFEVRAINRGSQVVLIGDVTASLPTIGLKCVAQKGGTNTIYELDLFKCKGAGAPITFTEKAFSEAEIPIKASFDTTKGGVMRMTRVDAVT